MKNVHLAAEKGKAGILKQLIEENQSNINDVDEAGFTPLIWAARNGHTRCVKIILNATGVDINKTDNQGNTALHWAAKNGHTSCVRLLRNKTEIKLAVNHAKLSPIHTALLHGHIKCAKLLQPQKTKKSLLLRFSALTITSALIICIFAFTLCIAYQKARINAEAHLLNKIKEHHESIKTNAISALDRIQIRKDEYGQQLFLVCKENGHENLQKLIEAGADVNIKNKDGKTPLHIAVENQHSDCIKILLSSRKTNINATDNDKKTPLHYAVESNNINNLELLLNCPGINIYAKNDLGLAPIHAAVFSTKCSTECLRVLLKKDNILLIKDKHGRTALDLIEEFVDAKKAKILKQQSSIIEKKVEFSKAKELHKLIHKLIADNDASEFSSYLEDITNNDNVDRLRSLLSFIPSDATNMFVNAACISGSFNCLKFLLETPGIEFDIATALCHAAAKGHADCVRLLLTIPDVKLTPTSVLYETPLVAAAKNGHTDCVKILLADPRIPVNATCQYTDSPLYEAIHNEHFSCAALIIAAGGKL